MFVVEALGFFGGISEDALGFVAERQVHGSGTFLAGNGIPLDLKTNPVEGAGREKTPVETFVFAQQAKQEMLRLDVGATELRCFVAAEEDDAARLFCESLEHKAFFQECLVGITEGGGLRN